MIRGEDICSRFTPQVHGGEIGVEYSILRERQQRERRKPECSASRCSSLTECNDEEIDISKTRSSPIEKVFQIKEMC